MHITLDPELMNHIEYDIWRQDGEWTCVAGRMPFLGDISGHGADPESALKDCEANLSAAFKSFNE